MTVINKFTRQCPTCRWWIYMTSDHPTERAHYARHVKRCKP